MVLPCHTLVAGLASVQASPASVCCDGSADGLVHIGGVSGAKVLWSCSHCRFTQHLPSGRVALTPVPRLVPGRATLQRRHGGTPLAQAVRKGLMSASGACCRDCWWCCRAL
jgi:hypothetical protein